MQLDDILSPAFNKSVQTYAKKMSEGGHDDWCSPVCARPFIISSLHKKLNRKSIVVAPTAQRASVLARDLEIWLGGTHRIFYLPAPDDTLYSRAFSSEGMQSMGILSAFEESSSAILVIPAQWLMRQVGMPECDQKLRLTTFDNITMEDLGARLTSLGYKRQDVVSSKGQWARRGGIIDIFSYQNETPVRLEFFGNSIDSIRYFDLASQRSLTEINKVSVAAAAMVTENKRQLLLTKMRSLDLQGLNPLANQEWQSDIAMLEAGIVLPDQNFYTALLEHASILSYSDLVYLDSSDLIFSYLESWIAEAHNTRREMIESGDLPRDFPCPHYDLEEIHIFLQEPGTLSLNECSEVDMSNLFHPVPPYLIGTGSSGFDTLTKEMQEALKQAKSVLLVSSRAKRLSELLFQAGIAAKYLTDLFSFDGGIALYHAPLHNGFSLDSFTVLTDKELYGVVKEGHSSTKKVGWGSISSYRELKEGSYVVHVEYGIGKYLGVKEMAIGSQSVREYLILQYAGEEKVYVPVDNLARVSAYIGGGAEPKVSRLSGSSWENAKKEARQAAEAVAQDLLDLYAQRELAQGFSFSADNTWQQEMEDAFNYVETSDQQIAIAAVKSDMESEKPMDRLILGDVGFGKTEVAMRAAFKAVMDSKQAAILVPTTILAQQHYHTFKERFVSFPVRIEVLSRFRTTKEQKEVLDKLKNGQVDIIIGTHRLLQKDVIFSKLGLLVIDEEQRFGVRHKEHLKKLRTEVDVLCLSATPIPRTLQMSLSGVRDLSIIETPPSERLPVKTIVAPESNRIIREAIMREIERGGQVFLVHNRVQSIEYTAQKIRQIVPEARVIVAHGQMNEENLAEAMRAFSVGEADVLVSTTIIENGVDIPAANTLIVSRADTFGLTQLYQLRGRVGRSSASSFAYLLYEKDLTLSAVAAERLQTLYDASSLGAGYSIAMKDLEIRGAGSLLGTSQSGFIAAVGFHMYSQMLAEAVNRLRLERSGKKDEQHLPVLDMTSVSLELPSYVDDKVFNEEERLDIYRRLSEASRLEQVLDMASEIRDRSAQMPLETQNLLLAARLRVMASSKGIASIVRGLHDVTITGHEGILFSSGFLSALFPKGVRSGRGKIIVDTKVWGDKWTTVLEEVVKAI